VFPKYCNITYNFYFGLDKTIKKKRFYYIIFKRFLRTVNKEIIFFYKKIYKFTGRSLLYYIIFVMFISVTYIMKYYTERENRFLNTQCSQRKLVLFVGPWTNTYLLLFKPHAGIIEAKQILL